jgi:hypothetical protein
MRLLKKMTSKSNYTYGVIHVNALFSDKANFSSFNTDHLVIFKHHDARTGSGRVTFRLPCAGVPGSMDAVPGKGRLTLHWTD